MCLFYKILYIHTRFAWNHRTVISWRIQAATWQVQIRVDSEARGERGMVDIEEWVSHTLCLTLCSTQPTVITSLEYHPLSLSLCLSLRGRQRKAAQNLKLAARSIEMFIYKVRFIERNNDFVYQPENNNDRTKRFH